MSVSDAIVVSGDWISEHYFTTDATKESFKARVLARRKEWDESEVGSVRTRFTAARADLLARLSQLADSPDLADEVRRDLLAVLGYDAAGLRHETSGPVDVVTQGHLPDVPGVAVVAGLPAESAEDLLDKEAVTLAEPLEREGEDPVKSVSRLLSRLFVDEDGPAFALVLAGRVALVAEKERWAEGRYLSVDLQMVCERNDGTKGGEVDRALTCLSAESLAPDAEGNLWWQGVLEESVKHTVGVSQDLREGVRLSIELIANEVVERRRVKGLEPLPQSEAQPLAKQALRYLYRILFLLYAEASPELGVLPVGAPEYDQGYSLDRLRELVQVPLTTPQAEHGTHLYESLGVLFRLVDGGYEPDTEDDDGRLDPLRFRSLRADLFHPEAVAHIDEVGLGNARLQQVLQHLLLSKESRGRDRGFISYAELGINQLGAVYEGLMSYTGRFAETDLYEVAKNGDSSKGSWLVPVERASGIDEKDFVRVEDPVTGERKPVLHQRGAFVFRLAGRERQQSASYYTPEVLTKFTVGQALEELLDQDGRRTTAEEILGLTVCEPALGSGAFAIEAVRQLAAEYLKRRQEELGERIDPEAYPRELQKVKAYLALHNVYGVDLNATAVELAEISLWLDTMVEGLHAPWFGLHLRRGNSLIGARRAVFRRSQVTDKSWLTAVPEPVTNSESLTGRVPHFLLPADGWGAAADVGKEIKDLVQGAVASLKAWRRTTRAKLTKTQVDRLVGLGERVDRLWAVAQRRLEIANEQVRRDIRLWDGDATEEPAQSKDSAGRHVTREEIEKSLADVDGAYRRLRRVMDAWCALWFWPLTEDDVAPPTLEQWFDALGMILGSTGSATHARKGDDVLASAVTWDELETAEQLDRSFASAMPIAKVLVAHPWLTVCERIAEQLGFFHWELDFAPVFAAVGGFHLQVGNPPWVRPVENAEPLLAEGDPWWTLAHKPSELQKARRRAETLALSGVRDLVVRGVADLAAMKVFLSADQNYPHLAGSQTDLYRCFVTASWQRSASTGVSGLIHPESHLAEERAARLRQLSYRRLRRFWLFKNVQRLFEMGADNTFAVNIYGSDRGEVAFSMASSIFHPDTVTRSLAHDGTGPQPAVKNESGGWDTSPHAGRIFEVKIDTLRAWNDVLGDDGPDDSARIVYSVNRDVASATSRLAHPQRLAQVGLQFSGGWHERGDRERGLFVLKWNQPSSWSEVILQGPHLFVSRPFYKVPNKSLRNKQDWSPVDLERLGPDEVPICGYAPAGQRIDYDRRFTHWGESRIPARNCYRVAWRNMMQVDRERSLIPALIPPGAAHVHGITSAGLPGDQAPRLVLVAGVMSSLIADFAVRISPKSTISASTLERVPMVGESLAPEIVLRTLRLNAVTGAYSELWARCWEFTAPASDWVLDCGGRSRASLRSPTPVWDSSSPLRIDEDRRAAQVEVDALVAVSLGWSVDELCTVYRAHFPILLKYDRNIYYYDANGRLVPSSVLTVWRKKGDAITQDERTATNASGNTYVYELPFRTLDREADMRKAYAHFEKRLAERGNA